MQISSYVALLGLVCVNVSAQEAQQPMPFVGYTMTFTGRVMGVDCTEWRLAEIKDNRDIISTCGDYRLEISGADDMNARKVVGADGKSVIEFKPYAPSLRFPLAVGTHWRSPYVAYTAYNGLVWDGEAQCESKAYEEITVQAGNFQAFRIECRDKWQLGPSLGYTHSTYWYAPEVAGVVKLEHREDPMRWNFELVSFGLAENTAATSTVVAPTPQPKPLPPSIESAGESGLPPILDPEDY
ncbi:MAG: hypothetical protein EXR86_15860 [Gammaproteobacteria bacterium]|nr:hypothetical protein [Gammaproteobacteria bacterium]